MLEFADADYRPRDRLPAVRRADGDEGPGARRPVATRSVLGVPAVRPALLVHLCRATGAGRGARRAVTFTVLLTSGRQLSYTFSNFRLNRTPFRLSAAGPLAESSVVFTERARRGSSASPVPFQLQAALGMFPGASLIGGHGYADRDHRASAHRQGVWVYP